jgi:flavin-dependent dehydrogenase
MERCDVLIVGGGPAGSSCAFGLRNSGLAVTVLDRETFPRDKVCAGWVTPQILAELEIDPADYRKDRVLQPIHGFRVGRVGDRSVDVDCGTVVSYGIRRCEFDHFLLERSGARLRLGERIRDLRRSGDRWIVNESLETPLLVGAGGHFCPVARYLGAAPGVGEPAVVARESEFRLDERQQEECPVRPELPELFFTRDLKGYGWLVRKGDYLNVGLGRQDPDRFPAHLSDFLDYLRERRRLLSRLPGSLRGHAYLLYDHSARALSGEGAMLVGDAAGLAYPRSGEGIRPAVESGLLAARSIPSSRPQDAPGAYARAVEARLGRRRGRPGLGVTDLLPEAWRGPVAGRFLANRWFARHVVVERWFLHRFDAPLGGETD